MGKSSKGTGTGTPVSKPPVLFTRGESIILGLFILAISVAAFILGILTGTGYKLLYPYILKMLGQ